MGFDHPIRRGKPVPISTLRVVASLGVACCFLLSACNRSSTAPTPSPGKTAVRKKSNTIDIPPLFRDATQEWELDFKYEAGSMTDFFFPAIMGGGAAFLDYDNDGDLDVYLVNGNDKRLGDKSTNNLTNQLFKQEDGKFTNATDGSGLDDSGFGMGVAVGDVNNDGFVDVYVTNYEADQLFLNQKDGSFRNITQQAGIDNSRWGVSATFLDYDRDGWLDLYVTNYVNFFPSRQCKNRGGKLDFCGPSAFAGTVDKLYRNLGKQDDGQVRFADVTVTAGIAKKPGPGLGVVAEDFNSDGWPDIYVANDGDANFLWINQKNGTFTDEAIFRGAAYDGQGKAQAGMGVALGDLNADGAFDLLVTHLAGESNAIYLNEDNEFNEKSIAYGMGVSSFQSTGFGVALLDLEHDGDEDVLISNGRVRRNLSLDDDNVPFNDYYAEHNQYFLRNSKGKFELVQSEDKFLKEKEISRALCIGDVDNDGDLDALIVNLTGSAKLYLNEAEKKGQSRVIDVRESDLLGNRTAYGAMAQLKYKMSGESHVHVRRINPGSSYCASHDPRIHFGVPNEAEDLQLEIQWPNGDRESFPIDDAPTATLIHGKGEKLE